MALFAAAVLNFSGRTGAREEETLRKAVARASVQCYAIEGRYPPSVEYLEENYAVQINRKKYNVLRWFRVQCDAGNDHHTHRRVGAYSYESENRQKGNAVSVLFTMLLFLVFVLCALFTVLIGSRVYENINVRSDANYTGNTALSYIANKVRQGDRAGW